MEHSDDTRATAERLARRYLDLWQAQISAMAEDPALADSFARFVETVMAGPLSATAAPTAPQDGTSRPGAGQPWTNWPPGAGMAPFANSGAPHGPQQQQPFNNAASQEPARGAASDAAASGGAGLDADQCARRLAALERRIADLEAGIREGRGPAARRDEGDPDG